MTPLMQTMAVYAPVVLVVVLALCAAFVMERRGWIAERELPIDAVLRRQGILLDELWTPAASRELSSAVQRCANCAVQGACRAWLDAGRRDGFEEFCPNAGFIRRAREGGRGAGTTPPR